MLKTFRADPSDTAVFARAASAGEWAVSGAFAYIGMDIAALPAKSRSEFSFGFLGLSSLGRSTFVQVVSASAEDHKVAMELLAQKLMEHFGAPDMQVARRAAEEEIAFSLDLAHQPVGRLIAVQRRLEQGAVREAFQVLASRQTQGPIRISEEQGDHDGP